VTSVGDAMSRLAGEWANAIHRSFEGECYVRPVGRGTHTLGDGTPQNPDQELPDLGPWLQDGYYKVIIKVSPIPVEKP
jgi:hypothetical protein